MADDLRKKEITTPTMVTNATIRTVVWIGDIGEALG
jgi:hypothetical protein